MLRGGGDTHVAVALERLARKFGVNVDTEDVRVPYRETIIGTAEAEGKVKKQSGGHGQYAVANLRVSPRRAAASGIEFVDSIVGGAIPRSTSRPCSGASRRRWPPAASTASRSSTCGSSATTASTTPSTPPTWRSGPRPSQGLQGGARARPASAVLEPVSLLTVSVPEGYQGDVLGDINSRAAGSAAPPAGDGQHEIIALVPTGRDPALRRSTCAR